MQGISVHGVKYNHVDSAHLDCISDNLAALLSHGDVQDIRTPFACQWYFDFDGATGLPILQKTPIEEMILRYTGYAVHKLEFTQGTYIQTCSAYLENKQPVLILGDAYFMPWLPYFGREHQEHSFIIDGIDDEKQVLHIVDAYYNQTEWGEAVPTATYLPARALERIIDTSYSPKRRCYIILHREGKESPVPVQTQLRLNAEQILVQIREYDLLRHFGHVYAEQTGNVAALRKFVLGCWLVARARALHALWLSSTASQQHAPLLNVDFPELFAEHISKPWQRVSAFSYVMLRRVMQGHSAPTTCFETINNILYRNEIDLATRLLKTLEA